MSSCSKIEKLLSLEKRNMVTEFMLDSSISADENSFEIKVEDIMPMLTDRVSSIENDGSMFRTHITVRISVIGQSEMREYHDFELPDVVPPLFRSVTYEKERDSKLEEINLFLKKALDAPKTDKYTFLASSLSESLARMSLVDDALLVIISDGREDSVVKFSELMKTDSINVNEIASKIPFKPLPNPVNGEVVFMHRPAIYDPVTSRSLAFWKEFLTPQFSRGARITATL